MVFMVSHFAGTSAVYLALAIVLLPARVFANEHECEVVDIGGVEERGPGMLQRSRSEVRPQIDGPLEQDKGRSFLLQDKNAMHLFSKSTTGNAISWTTNIGQEHHNCSGSHFKVDFTGTHSGLVVKKGMLLAKGDCSSDENRTTPHITQSLSCQDEATGCHMWCAPVWQSYYDTTDWSTFDFRCVGQSTNHPEGWDGAYHSTDYVCASTGQIFTWARAEVPSSKNELDLTFAISKSCGHWCAPLWVTLYDVKNWAKSYRWCFNRKDDWGVCDESEDVSLSTWHKKKFRFMQFMQKHGYAADQFVLELAVYSEFEKAEVLINSLTLSEVTQVTTPPPLDHKTCGSEKACGGDHQCCRKGDSEVDAKCCPKNWSCCEDSCCPSYFNCTITDAGHTCKPPTEEVQQKPELCNL